MSKPRILAIDDEVEFTEMLKSYFEPRGYTIDIALRGVKGLEMARQENPDVILMDLKMPGIDGDEALMLLKSAAPKSKVIFVTAYDDGGKTRQRLLDSGAYDYFDKPLTSLRDLEEAINRACREQA